MAYAIRRARPSDHALLPEIERDAGPLFEQIRWLQRLPGEHLQRRIHRGDRAERRRLRRHRRGRPPGRLRPDGFLDRALHIHELDVSPAHGRRGLGRRLVAAACAFAKAEGAPAATLSTFREVPWNAPFYATAGFREVPRNQWTPAFHLLHHREMAHGLPVERRCFMRKELA